MGKADKNIMVGAVEKRKRRSHEKSRQGCRNCKLRRVKCDETRPECRKCTNFGVTCNFDPRIPDLQMCQDVSAAAKPEMITFQTPVLLNGTHSKVNVPAFLYPAIDTTFHLDREHLDRFGRFYSRTVLTIGTPKASLLFQDTTAAFCFSHPFLMHAAQTITAIHDRYLSQFPWSATSRLSITESYHLTRAAALFSQRLSKPIEPRDRDPLWAAAAMLGIIAFSTIEAACPEEAWPLKPDGPSDFEWIDMSQHKMAVWEVTNPSRPDSAFRSMSKEFIETHRLLNTSENLSGIEKIPDEFVQLYELDETSTEDTSPYYMAVRKIVSLLAIDCDRASLIPYLNFVSHLQPEFKILLRQKDPRALLLMAYWYARVGRAVWWLERRTLLEGQATCLYLERYHADEKGIHDLLKVPKIKLGLLADSGLL